MLIKTEGVRGHVFATRAEARLALFEYIDGFYNSQPIQKRLGCYLSPIEFRRSTTPTRRRPMRAGRRESLLGLRLTDRRSGYPLQMVVAAADAGWRIRELNVPYPPAPGSRR